MTRQHYFFIPIIFILLASCNESLQIASLNMEHYVFQDSSLTLDVVASEPTITAPVAIDFDKKGRLWVAEMPDYMPDINGEKEHIPRGRILILEDVDGDGVMESSAIFMDSLPQLRAIRLFRNGILFGYDPVLSFAEIENDKPKNVIVIDSFYASGGNVEHKPNGLIKNVDNCFYNAKSSYRYCYNGEWTKEAVFFRGQWGISQDEVGRIYTNDNSNLLFGDAFLPAVLTHNPYINGGQGINEDLIKDRSVYPIHPTAINRGYIKGSLDEAGKLIKTTSACGPYIHQTSSLGEKHDGDGFVCVPEGNLIKKLDLATDSFQVNANFTYSNKEFLASTDEAFRPVNMAIGPDGNLYIVDFHRGIIQHKIYMTNYLREKILARDLDKIVDFGRVLRIRNKDSVYQKKFFDFESIDQLIAYLSHSNPWFRRMAQEELIFTTEKVRTKLYDHFEEANATGQIHTLWTLAGRNQIVAEKLLHLDFKSPWVIAHFFKILTAQKDVSPELLSLIFEKFKGHPSDIVKNHLVATSYLIFQHNKTLHDEIQKLAPDVLDLAIMSAYPKGEIIPLAEFADFNRRVEDKEVYYIHKKHKIQDDVGGFKLYNMYCSSCHGSGGEGIEKQAPSLIGAKLINGDTKNVPLVIMNGLEGQVTVNNQKDNYHAVMPGFLHSSNLTATEIAGIANFIYNAFSDEVRVVSVQEVDSLLIEYKDRKDLWTEEELLGTE